MILRNYWLQKLTTAWKQRSIVWLSGVRRAGKTSLAHMVPDAEYLNCDLPSVSRRLEDPEAFFDTLDKEAVVIFDEIHRLEDPSRLLKIGADSYPGVRILATGSSTLEATRKFRDSLTGRKVMLYLPPVLWTECLGGFGDGALDHRLVRGGLPEALLAKATPESFYAEWIDSYYARDIQELFAIRNRSGFLGLFRLLLLRSGGLMDYTRLSQESGLSYPTVMAHLEAMAIAHAMFLLPPFHGGSKREILKRPKVYAFDTGFAAYARGWDTLRDDDRGLLWEHLVLDVLRAAAPSGRIQYWLDKSEHEVDFIVPQGRKTTAVECKINPDRFNPSNMIEFRRLYPEGMNYVVSPNVKEAYSRRYGGITARFVGMYDLQKAFEE